MPAKNFRLKVGKQIRHLRGWRPDTPDHRDYKFMAKKLAKLPRLVSLASFCPRVEDQGDLGSCTAHASTSAMEFLYRKARIQQPELSRLFLYYQTRVLYEGVAADEDSGAEIRNVIKAMKNQGVCLERTWPYVIARFANVPPTVAVSQALNHQILVYRRLNILSDIKNCLASGYPVIGGFIVPESALSSTVARTGLIPYPGPRDRIAGGHAILFMGYNDNTQCLTFQNSWGTGWGRSGYGYLPYRYINNHLADDFWMVQRSEM